MADNTYSGNWKTDAHAINGQRDHHCDLADYAERKGFEILPDPDNNEKSFIARPGVEDFDERIIGEIVGDSEAVIKITANLD